MTENFVRGKIFISCANRRNAGRLADMRAADGPRPRGDVPSPALLRLIATGARRTFDECSRFQLPAITRVRESRPVGSQMHRRSGTGSHGGRARSAARISASRTCIPAIGTTDKDFSPNKVLRHMRSRTRTDALSFIASKEIKAPWKSCWISTSANIAPVYPPVLKL